MGIDINANTFVLCAAHIPWALFMYAQWASRPFLAHLLLPTTIDHPPARLLMPCTPPHTSPRAPATAPNHERLARLHCIVAFVDEARDNVAIIDAEVVVLAKNVGGNHGGIHTPVLLVVQVVDHIHLQAQPQAPTPPSMHVVGRVHLQARTVPPVLSMLRVAGRTLLRACMPQRHTGRAAVFNSCWWLPCCCMLDHA